VSLRLVISNPTLPEITDGYEIQLHHSMGHNLSARRFSSASISSSVKPLIAV